MHARDFAIVLASLLLHGTTASSQEKHEGYGEQVGHAYAYSRGPTAAARYCKHVFADLSGSIDSEVAEWQSRNAVAIREINAHWDAHVGETSNARGVERVSYYDQVERQNDQVIGSALRRADEGAAGYSRAYCQALAKNMLRDRRFDLEQELSEQLRGLRSCNEGVYCLKASVTK